MTHTIELGPSIHFQVGIIAQWQKLYLNKGKVKYNKSVAFLCGSIKIPDNYGAFSDLCYASRHSTLDSLVKTNARR
jgi:hypothetical protein